MQRLPRRSLPIALTVTLLVSSLLVQSTLVGAQSVSPVVDPSFFPATGYRVSSAPLLDYFQHRGGVRTFGYPISNEFPLLGKRAQLFQRQLLQLAPDGTVQPLDLADPTILPVTRIDGLA